VAAEDSNKLEKEIQKNREELIALQGRIKSLVNRRSEPSKTDKKETVRIELNNLRRP
jgi:hypothetical protein